MFVVLHHGEEIARSPHHHLAEEAWERMTYGGLNVRGLEVYGSMGPACNDADYAFEPEYPYEWLLFARKAA